MMLNPLSNSHSMGRWLFVALCFLHFFSDSPRAADKFGKNTPRQAHSVTGSPRASLLNINNMTMWANDNGMLERRPDLTGGVVFPRGTKNVVFAGGLVWGGLVRDGTAPFPQLSVGGQTYHYGTVPGAIIRPGVPESPNSTDVRIYRIRRDWATADLTQDAADYFDVPVLEVTAGQIAALRARYKQDWIEWPWQKGAPYYERNAIPGYQSPAGDQYDPAADEPGLAGADQVIWFVANDLDPDATTGLYGSLPIGIEMQVTCWAYARRPDLSNTIYQRFRLIYKGTATTPPDGAIESMYIAKWVDPDIGEFSDDLVGSVPEHNLGYAYNANETDVDFQKSNLIPPSIGYDLLQGPRVYRPGATGHWNLRTISDYANLPMTAFTYFTGDTRTSDFDFSSSKGRREWYNVLRGYSALPLAPPLCMIDPTTNACTNYEVWGDPETFRGWVDGRLDTAGDRRFAMMSGPFSMAFGDTQEVLFSLSGSLGANNREAVGEMQKVDGYAQDLYNFNFELPDSLPAPDLRIVELDKQFILDWESDTAQVRKIESYQSNGYAFETYNIYQLSSATASLAGATRFPPFDVRLPRSINLGVDRIRNRPLVNGQKYYFAVTAQFFNPDLQVANPRIESAAVVHTVTPHRPNPGVVYPYNIGQNISRSPDVRDYLGFNDAVLKVSYYDPSKPDGHIYKVKFHRNPNLIVDIDEKPTWDFVDVSEIHIGVAGGATAPGGGTQVLLQTRDAGTTWQSEAPVTTNILRGVSFVDVLFGMAVGDDGAVMTTTNGGKLWLAQNSGVSQSLYSISVIDSSRATAAGAGGIIIRTTNGGVSWSSTVGDPLHNDPLYGVSFFDALRGYTAGGGGVLLRTPDAGQNWYRDSSFTAGDLHAVHYPDLFTAFAAGDNGTILREKNFNIHWTRLASGTTADLLGMHFIDAHVGTVVGRNGTILRTTDEGATWSSQQSGTTDDLYGVSFSDSLSGVVVGANGTVLQTADGGTTWARRSSGTDGPLFTVAVNSDSKLLKATKTDTPPQRLITRGMSVQVTQPLYGLKGIFQVKDNFQDVKNDVYNIADPAGKFMLVGKGPSDLDTIRGGNASDADIEIRFDGDSSWAIMRGRNAPTSRWLRVPYTVWGLGIAGKDSFSVRLYSVISEQGGDSLWRPQVLLDREYEGKTLKVFYPLTIVNDTLRATDTSFYGTYYDDAPFRKDGNVIRGYLWVSSQEQTNHPIGIWKVYFADLDENGVAAPLGTTVRFERFKYIKNRDEKLFIPSAVRSHDLAAAQEEIEKINVFPNPYYGMNRAEVNRFQRFVTFSHLPAKATVRIFNLAGIMVRTLRKDNDGQFMNWDLNNERGLTVAAGIYLATIELQDGLGHDLGTKNLKLMIVPEDQQHESN